VSYEDVFSDVVKVIEGVGAGIMVVGGLFALGRYAQRVIAQAPEPYRELRENLGRAILLGLEVLIIADIIRTIVVDQSLRERGDTWIDRRDPDRAELLAGRRDRRDLAMEPLALRAARPGNGTARWRRGVSHCLSARRPPECLTVRGE
jgi:hypothetical protein